MKRLEVLTIPAMLQASFKDFADYQSLVFVGEGNLTYGQLELEVKKVALQLQAIKIKKGDKVAILSLNMPQWGIAFFATTIIGAVVVPILPDFHPTEIKNILEHAEVSAIFVSETLRQKLDQDIQIPTIHIENFELANSLAKQHIAVADFEYEDIKENDI